MVYCLPDWTVLCVWFYFTFRKINPQWILRELTRSGLSDVWDTFILPDVAGFNLLFDEIDV